MASVKISYLIWLADECALRLWIRKTATGFLVSIIAAAASHDHSAVKLRFWARTSIFSGLFAVGTGILTRPAATVLLVSTFTIPT